VSLNKDNFIILLMGHDFIISLLVDKREWEGEERGNKNGSMFEKYTKFVICKIWWVSFEGINYKKLNKKLDWKENHAKRLKE